MKREEWIDVLRGIGLLCIILAHVGPPGILFQIRNFDVPLMVLVAGSSCVVSLNNRKKFEYFKYVKNRFLRLVVPAWIFLLTFFIFAFFASLVLNKPFPFTVQSVISSFLLLSGIGYVWIIRVFFIVSLIAPFAMNLYKLKINKSKYIYMMMFVIYFLYEILIRIDPNLGLFGNFLLKQIVYMAVPYGIIFIIGTRMYDASNGVVLSVSLISLIVFLSHTLYLYHSNDFFVYTQKFKYPPSAYYISYAVFVSSILYFFVKTKFYFYIPFKSYISMIGRSSMWIYLWHIFILYLMVFADISINFVLKYIVVVAASVAIVMMQEFLLKRVLLLVGSTPKAGVLEALFRG